MRFLFWEQTKRPFEAHSSWWVSSSLEEEVMSSDLKPLKFISGWECLFLWRIFSKNGLEAARITEPPFADHRWGRTYISLEFIPLQAKFIWHGYWWWGDYPRWPYKLSFPSSFRFIKRTYILPALSSFSVYLPEMVMPPPPHLQQPPLPLVPINHTSALLYNSYLSFVTASMMIESLNPKFVLSRHDRKICKISGLSCRW